MSTEDDKLLEQYLAGDSELSREYRRAAGSEDPPARIDESLRAAARREVDSGPARYRRPLWIAPLAAAAVLVLAVGLTIQLARKPEPTTLPPAGDAVTETPEPETMMKKEIGGESRLQAMPPPEVREEAAQAPASTAADRERADPSAWLSRIRDLITKGDLQAARDNLARFRDRYPKHDVPKDITTRLDRNSDGSD